MRRPPATSVDATIPNAARPNAEFSRTDSTASIRTSPAGPSPALRQPAGATNGWRVNTGARSSLQHALVEWQTPSRRPSRNRLGPVRDRPGETADPAASAWRARSVVTSCGPDAGTAGVPSIDADHDVGGPDDGGGIRADGKARGPAHQRVRHREQGEPPGPDGQRRKCTAQKRQSEGGRSIRPKGRTGERWTRPSCTARICCRSGLSAWPAKNCRSQVTMVSASAAGWASPRSPRAAGVFVKRPSIRT